MNISPPDTPSSATPSPKQKSRSRTSSKEATADSSSSNSESGPDEYAEFDGDLDLSSTRRTRLYKDAALYGQVLRDATPQSTVDVQDAVNGFAEFVGQDLDTVDQQRTGRFAQFAVNDWQTHKDIIVESPRATLLDDFEGLDASVDLDLTLNDPEIQQAEPEPVVQEEKVVQEDARSILEASPKLSSEAIVDLLVREFGPLAAEGEKEEFVMEVDAAIFKSVAILVCCLSSPLHIDASVDKRIWLKRSRVSYMLRLIVSRSTHRY